MTDPTRAFLNHVIESADDITEEDQVLVVRTTYGNVLSITTATVTRMTKTRFTLEDGDGKSTVYKNSMYGGRLEQWGSGGGHVYSTANYLVAVNDDTRKWLSYMSMIFKAKRLRHDIAETAGQLQRATPGEGDLDDVLAFADIVSLLVELEEKIAEHADAVANGSASEN